MNEELQKKREELARNQKKLEIYEHRQKLIDTFVNAIYLYDDKVVITFNYKEGSRIVDFTDLNTAVAGSDLECSGAPNTGCPFGCPVFYSVGGSNPRAL